MGCEQSKPFTLSTKDQIIDLSNLIYLIKNKLKNKETDRWIQIFFISLVPLLFVLRDQN